MNNSPNSSLMNQSHQQSPNSTFLREDELILSLMGTSKLHVDACEQNKEHVNSTKVGGKISLVGFDPLLAEEASKDTKRSNNIPKPPLLDNSGRGSSSSTSHRPISGRPPLGTKSHRQSRSLGSCDLDVFLSGEIGDDLDEILNSGHRRRIFSADAGASPMLPRKGPITGAFRRRHGMMRQHKSQVTLSNVPDLSFQGEPGTPDLSPKSIGRRMSSFSLALTGNTNKSRSPASRSPPMTPNLSLSPTPDHLNMPLFAKPSPTSFLGGDTLGFRSSEQDPAAHQIEIMSSSVAIVASKLCSFLDFYRSIDMNFELGLLVGASRNAMNEFATLGKPLNGLEMTHRPIVRTLLDCGDSITVEGYYADESEVAVFNSQILNQLIVVYRGNDVEQARPVRTKQSKTCGEPNNFQTDHPLTVYPPFRDAYAKTESQVCKQLDQLTDADPFTDVVFTGHSFGAAMSICAALRYATMRPMTRVSCCALGAPRVGDLDLKRTVNTLPNLKVFRVEIPGDPVVQSPVESNGIKWEHAGHTLAVDPANKTIRAYRFDKNKPNASGAKNIFMKKVDRSNRCYVEALEQFCRKWVVDYCEEESVSKNVRGRRSLTRAVSVGKKQ